jgi:hypothetical protein
MTMRNSAVREPSLKTAPLVQGRWVAARMAMVCVCGLGSYERARRMSLSRGNQS